MSNNNSNNRNNNSKTIHIGLAILAIASLATLVFIQTNSVVSVAAVKQTKVTICHEGFDEDTNSTTFKTINIGPKAAAKHLANHEGDTPGPCP